MRKTDKKIDNHLRLVLTDACEAALKDIVGFEWLTHLVNYSDFPKSLKVICVFDTNDNLNNYLHSDNKDYLQSLIATELSKIDIKLKNANKYIAFDTEENCTQQHDGNWSRRLG